MQHAAFSVWLLPFVVMQRSPTFLAAGMEFMEDNFSMNWGVVGGWFWDNQVCYIYCATLFLLLYYYDVSCTSGHQALDSRGWGPLP